MSFVSHLATYEYGQTLHVKVVAEYDSSDERKITLDSGAKMLNW